MADSPLDPDAIARKTFLAGFRGYEQQEVRAYLHDLAQRTRRVQQRLEEAEARLADLEPLAHEIDAPIDPSRLAQLVGEETARVLEAARSAADEITSKAEEAAARVVAEATAEAKLTRQAADDDARQLRDEAEHVLARRTADADRAAEEILTRAERDAAAKREDAEVDHARALADAERLSADAHEEATQIVAEAKAQGRSIITESKALRQKVLEDLGRRRQTARAQVARLNAGRERLLSAYEMVQRTLDETTGELTSAVGEARAAADTAALRIQDESIPTVEELEAELGIAADADLLEGWDDDDVDDDADRPVTPDSSDDDGPAPDADEQVVHRTEGAAPDPAPAVDVGSSAETRVPEARARDSVSPPIGHRAAVPTVTSDELPEIDADLEPSPVEDPPQAIVLPRKSPKRRLLRRDSAPTSTLLPPAELVPLTERHEVEGVRLVAPEAAAADSGEPPDAPVATTQRVDALFARIRAERAEALATAEHTLDDDAEAPGDETPTDGSDAGTDREIAETEIDPDADDGHGRAARGDDTDTVAAADAAALVLDDATDDHDAPQPTPDALLALEAMSERDEALGPLVKELNKRLKRALADEQNELLDALRRSGDDDVIAHLPDPRAHAAMYITAAGSVLVDAVEAGITATGEAQTPDIAEIARSMAEAICMPLRDRFERAREESQGDPDELDTRLRACYREWKSSVLPAAGDDALVAAWSLGVLSATPSGCGLRWLVAPGSAPCPDADDNALAGVVEPGSEFPTGDLVPPAHPGCRCLVVPASQ